MNFINWFDVGTHKPKIKKRDKEFFGYKKYVKPKITDITEREKKIKNSIYTYNWVCLINW